MKIDLTEIYWEHVLHILFQIQMFSLCHSQQHSVEHDKPVFVSQTRCENPTEIYSSVLRTKHVWETLQGK